MLTTFKLKLQRPKIIGEIQQKYNTLDSAETDSTSNYLKTKKIKEVARASTAGRPLPLPVVGHLQSPA